MTIDPRIHDALTICVRAINLSHGFGYSPDDTQQSQLAGLAAEIRPWMEALAAEPYRGKGLGCGYLGHRGYRTPWQDMMNRLRDSSDTDNLEWMHRMEALFDTAGMDADAMLHWADQLQDDILRDHLLLHAAADLAAENEMAHIERDIVPRLRPDIAYRAARVMLMEHARHGDANAFLALHKRCDKRKERHTLTDACACACLAEQVATRNGIEEALALCGQKGFESYRTAALQAFAATQNVAAMGRWLAAHPADLPPDPGLNVALLVTAYANIPPQNGDADPFDMLFERVDGLDKSIRHGGARLRDALLLDLGMAAGPGERRQLCRRKIASASLKRELD